MAKRLLVGLPFSSSEQAETPALLPPAVPLPVRMLTDSVNRGKVKAMAIKAMPIPPGAPCSAIVIADRDKDSMPRGSGRALIPISPRGKGRDRARVKGRGATVAAEEDITKGLLNSIPITISNKDITPTRPFSGTSSSLATQIMAGIAAESKGSSTLQIGMEQWMPVGNK